MAASGLLGEAVDRAALLVEVGRVRREIYLDDEVFRRELDVIFGESWVYLAHESEIE